MMQRWIHLLVVLIGLHDSIAGMTHHCGQPPIFKSKRIIGGDAADEHEFPWQAAMMWRSGRTKGEHICGGSLISNKFVLTAAHCFEHGEIPHYYNFTLGQHFYSMDSGREQQFHIKRIIIHPEYDYQTYDNDIALIELNEKVKYSDHVYPICLPHMVKDFEIAGKICTITGWGANRNTSISDFLKKAEVPIISQRVCNSPKSYGGKVTWNMFCAGYPDGRADSCGGDSGGPLQCISSNGMYVINGVTSWGHGCGAAHKYGVYVRVRHFLDWINLNIHNPPSPPNPPTPPAPPKPKTPPVPQKLKTPLIPNILKSSIIPQKPKTPPLPSNPQTQPVAPNPKKPLVPTKPQTPPVPPKLKTPLVPAKPNTPLKPSTTKATRFTIFPTNLTLPKAGRNWNDYLRKLRQIVLKRLRKQKEKLDED